MHTVEPGRSGRALDDPKTQKAFYLYLARAVLVTLLGLGIGSGIVAVLPWELAMLSGPTAGARVYAYLIVGPVFALLLGGAGLRNALRIRRALASGPWDEVTVRVDWPNGPGKSPLLLLSKGETTWQLWPETLSTALGKAAGSTLLFAGAPGGTGALASLDRRRIVWGGAPGRGFWGPKASPEQPSQPD